MQRQRIKNAIQSDPSFNTKGLHLTGGLLKGNLFFGEKVRAALIYIYYTMPKNDVYVNRKNNSISANTQTHDTGNNETYLTETNIALLKRMFVNEQTYIKHMETLWELRNLSLKACEEKKGAHKYDKSNPIFRLVELSNQLIGALSQENISFGFNGENISHYKQ